MNIQQAKEQIQRAVTAYRTRDAYGRLLIPAERQRPVFLVGAPGIGKTAIAAQVAQEMHIGFVSYSITHHTRQSALGLPFITDREFGGRTWRMSEYTMSEIIASVYDQMERTGVREGILFLDEINCVSETLAPAMLQFLQYKVFGRHRVPDGWVVVTAGNPPEYNRSARDFDMVTLDRLKKVEIEPDYGAWRAWAKDALLHPAVPAYLDVRREDFYQVSSTVDGESFVTPRGWVDLSDMLRLYELNGLPAEEDLVRQYLQNDRIARRFAVFYGLWKKYEEEYRIGEILAGRWTEAVPERVRNASFDERISVAGLLLDGAGNAMKEVLEEQAMLLALKDVLKELEGSGDRQRLREERIEALDRDLAEKKQSLSEEEQLPRAMLSAWLRAHPDLPAAPEGFRDLWQRERKAFRQKAGRAGEMLDAMLRFSEEAFPEAELSYLITSLASGSVSARFIGTFGCDRYYAHSRELLFEERNLEIQREIAELL